ncbi:DUF5658 family protein [Desulfococcus sp.]|uniref:DUF5658 family protein n=1 Tax=Desulfococcus sp. TaxID=2025834 RepID=UPI003593DF53
MNDTPPPNPYDGMERRSGRDRRQRKLPSLRDMLVYRRRRQPRRQDDRRRFALMDQYGTSIGVACIIVLLLSVTDAFLTLFLLGHGAVEINPVMAYFIEINEYAFIWAKYGLTVVSVFIVLILNYAFMRKFRLHARHLLNYFALIFALIVVWELYLVMRIVV